MSHKTHWLQKDRGGKKKKPDSFPLVLSLQNPPRFFRFLFSFSMEGTESLTTLALSQDHINLIWGISLRLKMVSSAPTPSS